MSAAVCGFCSGDDEAVVVTPDGIVEPEERKRIQDETYYSALALWSDWKRFGLPHGCGYYNERGSVITAIKTVDTAYKRVEVWKMEKAHAKHKF